MVQQIKRFISERLFFISASDDAKLDKWKFRRKLIFGSYRIAIFVTLVSLIIAIWMPQLQDLAIAAIQAMVGMLSIIVSAYVGGAIVDDRLNQKKEDIEP